MYEPLTCLQTTCRDKEDKRKREWGLFKTSNHPYDMQVFKCTQIQNAWKHAPHILDSQFYKSNFISTLLYSASSSQITRPQINVAPRPEKIPNRSYNFV